MENVEKVSLDQNKLLPLIRLRLWMKSPTVHRCNLQMLSPDPRRLPGYQLNKYTHLHHWCCGPADLTTKITPLTEDGSLNSAVEIPCQLFVNFNAGDVVPLLEMLLNWLLYYFSIAISGVSSIISLTLPGRCTFDGGLISEVCGDHGNTLANHSLITDVDGQVSIV